MQEKSFEGPDNTKEGAVDAFTPDRGDGIPPDAKYPGIFTAPKERLGLELKPEKAPVEVIIVESATEPVFD
ncbi:MAG TPA: DUF3738 domain-containing protein [Terracidiphilus sp.]|nr:DUF3738 domain-containing protein [Terracidiphilus sp.]